MSKVVYQNVYYSGLSAYHPTLERALNAKKYHEKNYLRTEKLLLDDKGEEIKREKVAEKADAK